MFRRSGFYLLLTIIGALGSIIALIGFILPSVIRKYTYGFTSQSVWSTVQSIWWLVLGSPINIWSYIFIGIMAFYFCVMFFPLGITVVSIFSDHWNQYGVWWLLVGIVFASIGLIISLLFDAILLLFSGYVGFLGRGGPLAHSSGPGVWLAPIGFFLPLICYSLLIFQEVKARKRGQVGRSQNKIIEPGSFI